MEKLAFKLEVFEGPLDLLMHLIRKNKINIYDIPIAEITDQYIKYLNHMTTMDLDLSSEFLVMAAQLLYIKSKMLLPKHVDSEEEEEDPRQELVNRLLEYKQYQEVSFYLGERVGQYQDMFFKNPDKIENYKSSEPLICISVEKLTDAFQSLVLKQYRRMPPSQESFAPLVKKEIVSVDEKMEQVIGILKVHPQVLFLDVFRDLKSKAEIVASFLAVLELIKIKKIRVVQNIKNKTIYVQHIEDGELSGY